MNAQKKAKVLEHFASQSEKIWEQFAKLMDDGYFSTDVVSRMFGDEAKEVLFAGKVRATVEMTWNPESSSMDPEEFTPEVMQEQMNNADSTHVCQTSSKGRYYGDWATIESIETEMKSPTPESVFGTGNEKALIFAVAEETVGREAILEKVPSWRQYFEEKPVSTITVVIERPNTTSKNDVASYLRSFVRDYMSGIHPSNTVCTEIDVLIPDELQAVLDAEENEEIIESDSELVNA